MFFWYLLYLILSRLLMGSIMLVSASLLINEVGKKV